MKPPPKNSRQPWPGSVSTASAWTSATRFLCLEGQVASDQDLSTVRSAALEAGDTDSIDLTGLEVVPGPGAPGVAGPAPRTPDPGPGPGPGPGAPAGSPPPGFVPPTEEQRLNLQREIDRVLAATPLVSDPASTSLNELQLEVLDSVVIGLLEAHPGVPIRLVGYTDQSGSDFDNSLLSFDRANAVRDYLISRGVPEFIVRAEGRGENDAGGEADADRRVEIEVIDVLDP